LRSPRSRIVPRGGLEIPSDRAPLAECSRRWAIAQVEGHGEVGGGGGLGDGSMATTSRLLRRTSPVAGRSQELVPVGNRRKSPPARASVAQPRGSSATRGSFQKLKTGWRSPPAHRQEDAPDGSMGGTVRPRRWRVQSRPWPGSYRSPRAGPVPVVVAAVVDGVVQPVLKRARSQTRPPPQTSAIIADPKVCTTEHRKSAQPPPLAAGRVADFPKRRRVSVPGRCPAAGGWGSPGGVAP
jgi:hypothetical protein